MQDVCSTFDLPGELESFCIRQRQSMLMKFLLLFTKNLTHELNYRLTLIKCCCRHYMKQEKKNTWSKNCETCITQELKGPLLWEFVEDYIYIVKFQKIPIPPPWKGFFSKTPTPLEIPIKPHTFLWIFWPYRTPHPPGNSNPFCGGSMDIFWNCKLYSYSCFMLLETRNLVTVCVTVRGENILKLVHVALSFIGTGNTLDAFSTSFK